MTEEGAAEEAQEAVVADRQDDEATTGGDS